MTALQEAGSWKLEVKVGSLQKSNITRAADRDGVTNCNRLVRKMHCGGCGGGKVEGTVSFRRDERNPNDPSYWICGGSVRGRPSKYA